MIRWWISSAPLLLLAASSLCCVTGFSSTSAFGLTAAARLSSSSRTRTVLFRIRCEDKYYQLEEMEDKDNCTTELFLKSDRTVEFGITDGPRFTSAVGTWHVPEGTNDFTMEITRTFDAGREHKTSTQGDDQMGEFSYKVKRIFSGEMTNVGASVGITGTAVAILEDNNGKEINAGYFNMIDATDERLGDDKKV